jgi:hypothetical protein
MSPSAAASGRQERLDSFLVALFACALAAPWVDEIVRTDKQRGPESHEQRAAAARPAFEAGSILSFPEKYGAYFDDTFGLRDWLLRWHSIEKYFGFGVSPTSRVVLGKDDWMFYTGDQSVEAFRGLEALTEQDLHKWQVMLEAKRDYLKQKGIQYLFVIAPNKESIYSDYWPPRLNRVQPLTRMDQLVEYMKQHSDLEILDLRPALRAARGEDSPGNYLYFPLGTHWNGRGSYVSYREIIDRLGRSLPPLRAPDTSELVYSEMMGVGDSWAQNMYIADLLPQLEDSYTPREPRRAHVVLDTSWGSGRKHWFEVDDPSLPRAVMFNDSFGAYIDELMAEHFSRLTSFWQYQFDPRVVADERPDVVIELFVERALSVFSGSDLLPRLGDISEQTFAESHDVIFNLDVTRDAASVKPLAETVVHTEQDDSGPALVVDMKTLADTLLMPDFPIPPASRLLGRIDITSPARSTLSIFYLHQHDADYTRKNSCTVPLSKGRNQAFFEIDEQRLHGPLRIRPGDQPGRYTLQGLEIRALPPK